MSAIVLPVASGFIIKGSIYTFKHSSSRAPWQVPREARARKRLTLRKGAPSPAKTSSAELLVYRPGTACLVLQETDRR